MKFAQEYRDSLERGEYPDEWIGSALSYRKLKKCIKKVQQELQHLGLDRETLETLWQHFGATEDVTGDHGDTQAELVRYSIPQDQLHGFTPRLTLAIDPRDGTPMDAWLNPETKQHLLQLVREQKIRRGSVVSIAESDSQTPEGSPVVEGDLSFPVVEDGAQTETVDIPLNSDSEFFQILKTELTNLDRLQHIEQEQLQSEVVQLGHELGLLKDSKSKRSKRNIEAWREIFRLYMESQIFFSSNEQDAGSRDSGRAQQQLQVFTKALSAEKLRGLELGQAAGAALERFVQINLNLLRFIKFQEINLKALTKILKKFDKQTALRSQLSKPQWLTTTPFVAQDLARSTCFTISEELLQVVPQLDDYLCPICFSISFKPIRLRCNHVFCIRCLIVMQRDDQNHCPLCRDEVVLEASSDNLDLKLMKFLKSNFPHEVKEKQRANELAAGVDRFGESFQKTHRCTVM